VESISTGVGARRREVARGRDNFATAATDTASWRLPRTRSSVTIDATELAMLLDGIDVVAVKRPRKWEPPTTREVAPA